MSSTILVAISGPSCSGKTTLSRLLRDALNPHAFILHEDDFFVSDSELPEVTTPDGRKLKDWDCLEALDLVGLEEMLKHVKSTGNIREGFYSKENQNTDGEIALDEEKIMETAKVKLRSVVQASAEKGLKIAIVDGFLLFSERMTSIRDLFDVKMLLTSDYSTVKRRRESRKGYVTLEGFWEDPPGYVDEIVWPNYVKDHKFLYRDENIENDVDEEKSKSMEIAFLPPYARDDIPKCFTWAADVLAKKIESSHQI